MSRIPKARAKAVVDGNGVNIPQPAEGDEGRKPFSLIGLGGRPGTSRNPFKAGSNPVSPDNIRNSSLLTGSGIFCLIPIDYAFRPHLRGRLTLRRLALRRNPWTFGESVSHTLCRYSCQHSHFRYLQPVSRLTFTGLRNAPQPRALLHTHIFGEWLEPRYIFRAGSLDQ